MRQDLRELDPNSQNSPIQGPLGGVKKLIENILNIVEMKGRATIFIFILRVEERRGMLHLRFLIF